MNNLSNVIRKYRPNWPLPTRLIGQGGYGKVYNTNNGRVMKVTFNNASNEFNILKQLKTAPYVPHVKNGNFIRISENNASGLFGGYYHPSAFIMNKVGGANAMTLRNYKKKYEKKINKNALNRRLLNHLSNLQVRGVLHRNLHGGNIIVTSTPSGKITGMWVIDFGSAKRIPRNGYNSGNLYHMLNRNNAEETAKKLAKRRIEIRKNIRLLTNSKKRLGRSKSV